mmetsp:Transcript_86716/g.190344  ORF Transcript_86716/g.190344 Transcript_86716/m.190344 type:complete len:81 (-) Transcript_86716:206-448(-)
MPGKPYDGGDNSMVSNVWRHYQYGGFARAAATTTTRIKFWMCIVNGSSRSLFLGHRVTGSISIDRNGVQSARWRLGNVVL